MKLAGKPVNINYVFEKLDEQGIETASKKSIEVMICHNKRLFNKIKNDCSECGHHISYYSLTDKALIELAHVERSLVEPSLSEWHDLGIMVGEGT